MSPRSAATVNRAPWLTHFGFTRTPFSKSLAPAELYQRQSHQEAVARILHCVQERSRCQGSWSPPTT